MHSNIVFVLCAIIYSSCIVSQVYSRTIQWTAAGGNPLWDSPNNWDSLTVPTINDDVIINVANIAGNVRIGSGIASCNSITIGGNSGTSQILTIFTTFNIGSGGANILSNGQVILNSSPTTPLSCAGTFTGNSKFTFISGSLAGTGNFVFDYVPFNGTAQKVINTTVTVNTLLDFLPMTGPGSILIASSSLIVKGTFSSTTSATLTAAKNALLDVQGTFVYAGQQTDVLTFLGEINIVTLTMKSGTIIFNDNATISSSALSAGAMVTVIGAQTSHRKFGDVTGNGVVNIQGGTNYFNSFTNVGTIELSGGLLIANGKASTINTLVQTGGQIQGGQALSISTATLTNADIISTPIAASVLYVHGYSQITGTTLTVTSMAVIQITSQFTLSQGAQFIVAPMALVTQSAAFQILPSGGTNVPSFTNNGHWTSSVSDLKILVNTKGSGLFQFGSGASMEITGVAFNTGALSLIGAQLTCISATVTVGTVSGTGMIQAQGQNFIVTDTLAADQFTLQNGFFSATSVIITNLDILIGTFNITGNTSSVTNFSFQGGDIGGSVSGTVLTVGSLNIIGNQPKTFTDIVTQFIALDLTCDVSQCQLFTDKARIVSKSSTNK